MQLPSRDIHYITVENVAHLTIHIHLPNFFLYICTLSLQYVHHSLLNLRNWLNSKIRMLLSFSGSAMSHSFQPCGLQLVRLPCPSPPPRCYSLSLWCHPTISSSAAPFSFCLQSFTAPGSFPISWLFTSSGQSIGASTSAPVLPMNIQDWFSLRLTGLISLLSNRFSSLHQHCNLKASILPFSIFFMVQLSHLYMTTGKTIALTIQGLPCGSADKESICSIGDPGSVPGKDPLEKGKAAHSSILAWRIPWTV